MNLRCFTICGIGDYEQELQMFSYYVQWLRWKFEKQQRCLQPWLTSAILLYVLSCQIIVHYSHTKNRFSYFLLAILFVVWIFDITGILIILNNCCSHTTVILMAVSANLFWLIPYHFCCTCMCYIPYSTCKGSDSSCMNYFNPDLKRVGPTS